MRRTLTQLLRAASLLLCIGAVILWIRSYHIADGFAWQRADGSEREIVSYAGGIHIRQLNPRYALVASQPMRRKIKDSVPANATWQNRAGPTNEQVLWERGGFVVFAGHTQVLTLTGSNAYNWSGVMTTSYPITSTGTQVSSGTTTVVPVTKLLTGSNAPITSGSGTFISGSGVIAGGTFGGSTAVFTDSMQLLVVIPYWFIVLMLALLAGAPLLRVPAMIRTSRRRRRGLCQRCGYDLRACGDRCPECGLRRGQE